MICPNPRTKLDSHGNPGGRTDYANGGVWISAVSGPRSTQRIVNKGGAEVMLLPGVLNFYSYISLANGVPANSITSCPLIDLDHVVF